MVVVSDQGAIANNLPYSPLAGKAGSHQHSILLRFVGLPRTLLKRLAVPPSALSVKQHVSTLVSMVDRGAITTP